MRVAEIVAGRRRSVTRTELRFRPHEHRTVPSCAGPGAPSPLALPPPRGLPFWRWVTMASPRRPKRGLPYEERAAALHELAELSKEPNVSVRMAAEQVALHHGGLKAETLRKSFIRHHGEVERTNVHQLLADDQEQLLLGVIRGFSLANRALSKLQIINLVRAHWNLGADWNGQSWYSHFLSRHSASIKPRHSHELSPKRTAKDLLVLLKAWVSEVGEFLEEHTFRAGTTWNADETLMTLRNLGHGIIRVEWMGKGKSNFVKPRGLHTGSLIIFSNGEGHTVLVVIILPADFGTGTVKELDVALPDLDLPRSENVRVCYSWTRCGRMTDELWENVMDEFLDLLEQRDPGLEQVIYLDRLGSHLQPAVAAKCLTRQLWTLWFPPDTSEFLQPADAYQFGAFHHELNLAGERFHLSALAQRAKPHEVVLQFLEPALLRATAQKVVRAGFAETGIWPFDKDKILQNGHKFLSAAAVAEGLSPVPPVVAEATAATMQVLESERPPKKARHLHARVERSKIYTAPALLAADQKRREAAAQQELEKEERRRKRAAEQAARAHKKQVEKEAAAARRRAREREKEKKKAEADSKRATYSCKSCGQRCWNQNSPTWLWCEYCDTFGVCPTCGLSPRRRRVLAEHERQERLAGKAPLADAAPGAASPLVV